MSLLGRTDIRWLERDLAREERFGSISIEFPRLWVLWRESGLPSASIIAESSFRMVLLEILEISFINSCLGTRVSTI